MNARRLRVKLIKYKLIELIILVLVILGFVKFAVQHHSEQEVLKRFIQQVSKQHAEHHRIINKIQKQINIETDDQNPDNTLP